VRSTAPWLSSAHQGDMILRMEVGGYADHAATRLRAIPGVVSLSAEPLPTDSPGDHDGGDHITGLAAKAMQPVNAQGPRAPSAALSKRPEDCFIA